MPKGPTLLQSRDIVVGIKGYGMENRRAQRHRGRCNIQCWANNTEWTMTGRRRRPLLTGFAYQVAIRINGDGLNAVRSADDDLKTIRARHHRSSAKSHGTLKE